MVRVFWKKKVLLSFVCLSVFVISFWIPSLPKFFVSAVDCTGHECDGFNPYTMGCGSDAVYGTKINFINGVAEHRISVACDAKWERTRLTSGADRYAAGSLRFGGANYDYHHSVSSPAKISAGEQVYTPMEGDRNMPTRACGKLLIAGPISIPIPVSDSYCSSVD